MTGPRDISSIIGNGSKTNMLDSIKNNIVEEISLKKQNKSSSNSASRSKRNERGSPKNTLSLDI
jgi:hypothetical protein